MATESESLSTSIRFMDRIEHSDRTFNTQLSLSSAWCTFNHVSRMKKYGLRCHRRCMYLVSLVAVKDLNNSLKGKED